MQAADALASEGLTDEGVTEEEFQHANDLVRLPCSSLLCFTMYLWLLHCPALSALYQDSPREPAQVSAYCFSFALAAGERTRLLLPVLVCSHAQPLPAHSCRALARS